MCWTQKRHTTHKCHITHKYHKFVGDTVWHLWVMWHLCSEIFVASTTWQNAISLYTWNLCKVKLTKGTAPVFPIDSNNTTAVTISNWYIIWSKARSYFLSLCYLYLYLYFRRAAQNYLCARGELRNVVSKWMRSHCSQGPYKLSGSIIV